MNDAPEIADDKTMLDDADAFLRWSCARILGTEHPRKISNLVSGTASGREEFQNSDKTRDELQTRLDSHQLAAVNCIVRNQH